MARAKYRIVRHEVDESGWKVPRVYYTVQRRRFLRWSTITRTVDCSDFVPNCYGSYTEPVEFGNEVDAADYLRRYIHDHRPRTHFKEVFQNYDENGATVS